MWQSSPRCGCWHLWPLLKWEAWQQVQPRLAFYPWNVQIPSHHTHSLSNPTVSPVFNWQHLALQAHQAPLFEETKEGGVPLLYPCSPGIWVPCSLPQKSPTAFPLPSINLFSKRLQIPREHWETSQKSGLCGWVGIEVEVSYPWKHLRVEMITLSFFNALGLQVTNTVKDSPWKAWQYFSHLSAVTTSKLIWWNKFLPKILIKRPFPAFEIAVLPLIKVWLQLIFLVLLLLLLHFSHFGCTFPCLPAVTGHPTRRISPATHWTQWGDDDRIKAPHGASAQTQNYSDRPECINSLYGNCK